MNYHKILAAVFASCLLASCIEPLTPALPPLLEGATSGSGADFLCNPFPSNMPSKLIGGTPENVSQSPEIVARLRAAFPPGTSAASLQGALLNQGFKMDTCPKPNLKRATFNQTGGGGILYQAFANVTWKTDASGQIEWATGNISFRGL